MKILVIGSGAVASVLSHYLSKDKNISEAVFTSRDLNTARKFIKTNKKIHLARLDASKIQDIINLAKGKDLIINASLPALNENVMKAALEVNANYQDLGSFLKDSKTVNQLKYHQKFKKAGLIGLIHAGIAPGITNVLAGNIAEKLDSINEIKIRFLEEQDSTKFVPSWSIKTTVDELVFSSLEYSNNHFKYVKPLGDVEEYEFPKPYGKKKVSNILGDEVSTIPLYIKTKNVNLKSGGSDIDVPGVLYNMGLLSKKPIIIGNKKIIPQELIFKIFPRVPSPKEMSLLIKKGIIKNSIFISVVEGIGKKSWRKVRIKSTVIYPDLIQINKRFKGATYISYPTGMAVYAFAKNIPKIKEYGIFPPEALSYEIRNAIISEIRKRGIVIKTTTS